MHPRNLYNKKPDFGELSEVRPSLKKFLISRSPAKYQPSSPSDGGISTSPLDHNSKLTSSPQQKTDAETSLSSRTEHVSNLKADASGQNGTLTQSEVKFAYMLDFSNPSALRELTCAVLERDFGLKVELPLDRLIPAVPQRLNYIHWVEDLLMCCQREAGGVASSGDDIIAVPKGEAIIGIDIGTGPSCIYPLLATAMNGWKFLATEIDKDAVRYARENVSRNSLENKIEVKQVDPSTMLVGAVDETVQYSFCMCNPPFFRDSEERYGGGGATRSKLRPPPKTFSGGTPGEMITEGGEVEFVKRIVQDSLVLRSRVRWYSSMLGKKASVKELLSELKHHQVPVTVTTEFVQGKTWRWAVAWSFDEALKDKVGNLTKSPTKRGTKRQRPLTLQLPTDVTSKPAESFVKAKQWLMEHLKGLKIEYTCTTSEEHRTSSTEHSEEKFQQSSLVLDLHCVATKNTWSHQRRRRRLMEKLRAQHSTTQQSRSTRDPGVGQEKTHADRGELQDNDHRGDQIFPRHLSGDSESKPSTLSSMTSSADDHSLPPHVATPNTEKSRSHDLGEGRGETMEVESSGLECHDDGNKEVSQVVMRVHSSVAAGDDLQRERQTELPATNGSEEEGRKAISLELESLSPPCRLEFKCTLRTGFPEEDVTISDDSHCHVKDGGGGGKRARGMDIGEAASGQKKEKRRGKKRKKVESTKRRLVEAVTEGEERVKKAAESAETEHSQLLLEFEWMCGDDRDMLHQVMQYFKNKSQNAKF